MSDLIAAANAIGGMGVATFLALVVLVVTIGGYREWWVPGPRYRKALKRADTWQELAMSALGNAEHQTELAQFFRNVAESQ